MRPAPRSALRWIKIVFANLGRSRTVGLAGEMAFWLFLSLIPIAAVAGLALAKFAFGEGHNAAAGFLSTLPPAVRELLTKELANVSAWNGGAVAPVAAATFVWLASSGVQSVFDGLELETEANPRPWWKKRLLAIGTCVALSVGVALIALLSVGVAVVQKFASGVTAGLPLASTVSLVVRTAVSAIIAVALVSGLYAVGLPPRARKRMPIIPGAIVAVALQTALGVGYGMYVRRAGDSGAYQAGLAVIGVTLMALYLLCIALLVGVEVNQVLGARRLLDNSVHPPIAPPPPMSKKMVGCDDEPKKTRAAALRPSLAGGQ
jgi:membrane protein